MNNYLASLSENQLERLYRKLYARIERAFAGGTRYGIDLPTLRMCEPGYYSDFMRIKREMIRREM